MLGLFNLGPINKNNTAILRLRSVVFRSTFAPLGMFLPPFFYYSMCKHKFSSMSQRWHKRRPFKKGEAHQRVRRWAGRPAGRLAGYPAGRSVGRWPDVWPDIREARVSSAAPKKNHLIEAAPFGRLDRM